MVTCVIQMRKQINMNQTNSVCELCLILWLMCIKTDLSYVLHI